MHPLVFELHVMKKKEAERRKEDNKSKIFKFAFLSFCVEYMIARDIFYNSITKAFCL